MKPEIIPAILAKSKKEFLEKLEITSGFARTVQIDIMDGLFVPNRTPKDLNNGKWFGEFVQKRKDIEVPDVELHLMVMDPWEIIREWHEYADLKRVIWHIELPLEHGELIEVVHDLQVEAGLAINPKSDIRALAPFVSDKNKKAERADEILMMGVEPGFSGQKFKPSVLKKISTLRKKYSHAVIGIDGGVNPSNMQDLIKAGAERANAAGAVFCADDPACAFRAMTRALKQ